MKASRRSLRSRLLLPVLTLAALALGSSSALAAGPVAISSAPRTVRAGQTVHLTARLSGVSQTCQLRLSSGGRLRKASSRVSATHRYLTWTWTVPRNARASQWVARVACSRGSAQAKLAVHGHGHALVLASVMHAKNSGAPLSASHGGNSGGGSGPSGGSGGSDGSGGGSGGGSGVDINKANMCSGADGPNCEFPQGGCEYYAYERRPDIVNRDTTSSMNWNAGYWASNAQHENYTVDTNPQPGDIAVWEYDGGPGPDGHVAYVESYDPSGDAGAGSMVVSEMDYNGNPNVTTRTVNGPAYANILFIHQMG